MNSIRPATEADLPTIARLFGEAFVDDPMLRWPFPPNATVESITQLFTILLDVYWPLDVITIINDVAAAVWLPPAQAERFVEIEVPTRDLIRPLTDDDGARYDVFWDWLGGHLPDEPCWFLDIVAVAERARGQGHARRLIEHGLSRAHGHGQPAFLETSVSGNVPMYEHLGFRVIEQAAAPDGGPMLWFMRADPPG
jgi:GNAT superfamily N-acetyltransferase